MDYIRQELLRQRAALARLLLGKNAEESADGRTGASQAAGAGREEAGSWSGEAAPEAVWGGLSRALRAAGGKRLADSAAEGGAPSGIGSPQDGYETVAAGWDEEENAGETLKSGRRAAGDERAPAAAGKRRPTVGNAGGAAWLETLAEEETGERSGERALSRLIQRDARRYDGGFSLY